MMIRPCFLGAGIATHLGTGVADNVAELHATPRVAEVLTRRIDGRSETIRYKLLRDFPVDDAAARSSGVVDTVIAEALRESGLSQSARREMALFVGSSSFDIAESENAYRGELAAGSPALALRSSSVANFAEGIRRRFDIRGEDFTFNTACTASANGLWYAARMIQAGAIENALVVGLELVNDLTVLGFYGLGLLSATEMRPFDLRRDGLVLGEACSALILGRGDTGRFGWLGGASLCDTHSMVAAKGDGATIESVIMSALADAHLAPESIDAVKAHGTANLANDDAESAGMSRAFGTLPPICALKPFIGHTLGACGLTELILFYRALEQGFLVATPGIGSATEGTGVGLNQIERSMTRGRFMLNSFGFGGSNTSLVIAR